MTGTTDRDGIVIEPAWASPAPLDKLVAALACVAVGASVNLVQGVTPGLLVALLLAPVWAGSLWLPLAGRWYALFGLAAIASGVLLTWWRSVDHPSHPAVLRGNVLTIATLVGTVGVVVWARRSMADRGVAILYAFGF